MLALSSESYLRQHAENPSIGIPGGDKKRLPAPIVNQPVLLIVGYSACHWCHVAAQRIIQNQNHGADEPVIVRLHQKPIAILSDVDQLYQQAHQLLAEGGGWPLTMFLCRRASLFRWHLLPPEDRYGRPSFRRILTALAAAYRDEKTKVLEYGQNFSMRSEKCSSKRRH